MKIFTKLDVLKNSKVSPEAAANISGNGDEVLAYTEDMSGTIDFATAKALAPILDKTDLCSMDELDRNTDQELCMLMAASAAAALSPEKKAAVVGFGNGRYSFTVSGQKIEIIAGTMDGIYATGSGTAPAKTQKKKENVPAPEMNIPAPEPYADEPKDDAVVTSGIPDAELDVDEDIIEPFMAYIPEDCGVDGVGREDFCKALYKALSESTSDADAVTRLESYIGADAGNVMKMIKERGLYDELRDLALL